MSRAPSENLRQLSHYVSSLENPDSSQQWRVCECEEVVHTPQGVRLWLNSASPFVIAETFHFQAHRPPISLDGGTVVDVGAYVGDTALYYSSLGAKVLAFEPDTLNFARMTANLALNVQWSKAVQPYRLAVGKSKKILFHSGLDARSEEATTRDSAGKPSRSVDLNAILSKVRTRGSLLLKSDARGCEWDLVQQSAISRFDAVLIEYHPRGPDSTVAQLIGALQSGGFRRFEIRSHPTNDFRDVKRLGPHEDRLIKHGLLAALKSEVS